LPFNRAVPISSRSSAERIRQIEAKALRKLKRPSQSGKRRIYAETR
jgi:DNA-directed RNA polymerase sigma subunit (sigma70/sigma32)